MKVSYEVKKAILVVLVNAGIGWRYAESIESSNSESAINVIKTESNNKYFTAAADYKSKAECYNSISAIPESGGSESNILSRMTQKIDECELIPVTSIEPYQPWQGTQFSAGGGSTTGNNNTTNIQANLLINYRPNAGDVGWNFNTIGQYDYLASDNNGAEKNRTYFQQNGYYMFNIYNGMFAQASYLNDVNNGYLYIWNENIGYQLQLFKSNRQNIILSIGPGIQQLQSTSSPNSLIQPTWLTQLTYSLNLSSHLVFTEQLQNIATPNNVTTYSIGALTIQAYKNLGIGLNYQFTYNSLPEPTKASWSTISGIMIVFFFD